MRIIKTRKEQKMADKNKNKNKKKDNKMLIMFPMLIISVILAFILYSYFEETKNDDGTKIYVKYIEGIPTLETIEVSKDKKNIKIKELNYSEKEAKKVLQKANRRQKSKIDIPKAIIDSGMKFCKMGESESNDIYCIIDGKTKLIRITNTEYVSVDKECYYLDTICIDLETGNQVDY